MGLLTLLIVAALMFIIIIYDALSWGLVTMKFWFWFLLPVFPELPELTFPLAVGLAFFISLFKNHMTTTSKNDIIDNLTTLIVTPWIVLVVGWIIYMLFIVNA